MSKKRSQTKSPNAQHQQVRSPLYRQRVVKAGKGRGSYTRKGRKGWGQPKAA